VSPAHGVSWQYARIAADTRRGMSHYPCPDTVTWSTQAAAPDGECWPKWELGARKSFGCPSQEKDIGDLRKSHEALDGIPEEERPYVSHRAAFFQWWTRQTGDEVPELSHLPQQPQSP
jgi:hypothetical protein